jgi:YD repeat-containing protein
MLVRFAFLSIFLGSSWLVGVAQVLQSSDPVSVPLVMNVTAADPFDVGTGIYFRDYQDLFVEDSIPISFIRTQRNMDSRVRSFGVGSSTSYDMFIIGDVQKFSWVALVMADGARVVYARISPGTGYADGKFENKTSPDRFYGSRISWNGRGGWTVTMREGGGFTIQGCDATSKPGQCAVTEERNAQGERLVVQRDRDGNVQRITSPHGKSVAVTSDPAGRITRAQDDRGHWVSYRYDQKGCLSEASNWRGQRQEFEYDRRFNMISIHETGAATASSKAYAFSIFNQYDEHDRLKFQKTSAGQQWAVEYITRENDRTRVANVTAPDGLVRYFFNISGYEFREEYLTRNRSGYNLDIARDPQSNFVRRMSLTCMPGDVRSELPLAMDIQDGESRRQLLCAICDRTTKRHTLPFRPNLPNQRWTESS